MTRLTRKVIQDRGPLIFEQVHLGGKQNVAYVVGDRDTGEVAVVDVGFRHELVLDRVNALGARIKYILATHSHRDHIGAAPAIKRATAAKLAAYTALAGVDVPLTDGDELNVAGIRIEVLHTPGHSRDSLCFLVDGRKLLTGDTLYVGRASKAPCAALQRPYFESLNRLMKLADEVEVWPGHDVGIRPHSTIGEERRNNAVVNMTFQDFCRRKWDRNQKRWVV